jgi:hypothetical protein
MVVTFDHHSQGMEYVRLCFGRWVTLASMGLRSEDYRIFD